MAILGRWSEYPVGIDEAGSTALRFTRREWDINPDIFLGKTSREVIPIIVKESRFSRTRFVPSEKIGNYHGGVIQIGFRVFQPIPHEKVGQVRLTGTGRDAYWVGVEVGTNGELVGYNPLQDQELKKAGYAVGLGSRVMINNLTLPGSSGGWAHLPMLDIVKSPTRKNVAQLIQEVKQRCGIEKFLVIKSSKKGMHVIGLELIDEVNFLGFIIGALRMNHFDENDYWIDDAWVARSNQNFRELIGLPNNLQVEGILRLTASPPLKPEEPIVIASSF